MQYQVPQFIEIEDKIFGPLTLKQFIYLAGGGGLCLLFFTFLPLYLTVVLGLPTMGVAAAFAFYEVNGRPLIDAVEHAFSYFAGSRLYLWKQRQSQPIAAKQAAVQTTVAQVVPKLSQSRLKDLAWSLNIKDQRAQADTAPDGLAI